MSFVTWSPAPLSGEPAFSVTILSLPLHLQTCLWNTILQQALPQVAGDSAGLSLHL